MQYRIRIAAKIKFATSRKKRSGVMEQAKRQNKERKPQTRKLHQTESAALGYERNGLNVMGAHHRARMHNRTPSWDL